MNEVWRLEDKLCRCCHAEGAFDKLSRPRQLNGITEVYTKMLEVCFDIVISSVPGRLHDLTHSICEPCIMRLRDAYDFMKQVQKCEEKFKDYYNRGAIEAPYKEPDICIIDDEEDSMSDDNDCFIAEAFLEIHTEELLKSTIEDNNKKSEQTKVKKSTKTKKEATKESKAKEAKVVKKNNDADDKEDEELLLLTSYTLKRNDDGAVHNCNFCKRNYLTRGAFTKHFRQAHLKLRKAPYPCHLCKENVSKHSKAFHLEDKHGIPAPTCNVCGRKFSFPYEVIVHQRYKHMGEKKFKCNSCGKCFGTKLLLKSHLPVHSATKDYVCNFCGKAFRTEMALSLHVRVHLNFRPHVCDICGKAFTQMSSLTYHKNKKHAVDV